MTTAPTNPIDQLVSGFREALEQQFQHSPGLAAALQDEARCLAIGREAAALVHAQIAWTAALGPYLTTDELVAAWMGDVAKVKQLTQADELVYLPLNKLHRYPRWQFDEDPAKDLPVHPVATAILHAFHDELGGEFLGETVISWAATPQPELDNQEPRAVLTDPSQTEMIILAARRAAHVLSH
jgi:hypothetical protein